MNWINGDRRRVYMENNQNSLGLFIADDTSGQDVTTS